MTWCQNYTKEYLLWANWIPQEANQRTLSDILTFFSPTLEYYQLCHAVANHSQTKFQSVNASRASLCTLAIWRTWTPDQPPSYLRAAHGQKWRGVRCVAATVSRFLSEGTLLLLYQRLSGQTALCQRVKVTGGSIQRVTVCSEHCDKLNRPIVFHENSPGAVVSHNGFSAWRGWHAPRFEPFCHVSISMSVPIPFVNGHVLRTVVDYLVAYVFQKTLVSDFRYSGTLPQHCDFLFRKKRKKDI